MSSPPLVSVDSGGSVRALSLLDMTEAVQDIHNVCRLCMSSKENIPDLDMVEISSNYPNTHTPISQLFIESLNIDINDASSNGMPNKICVNCLAELLSYSNFKKRSLSVDAKLRLIVSKKQKLAEAQALYGPVFFDLEVSSQCSDSACLESLYFEPKHTDLNSDNGVLDERTSKQSSIIGAVDVNINQKDFINTCDHLEENCCSSCEPKDNVNVTGKGLSATAGGFCSSINQECNASVQEGNLNIISDVVCANVSQDNCVSDVTEDFCTDVVGEVVITETKEDFSHLNFDELSSSVNSQDHSNSPGDLTTNLGIQIDVLKNNAASDRVNARAPKAYNDIPQSNARDNGQKALNDIPHTAVKSDVVNRKCLSTHQTNDKKRKRRRECIPIPQVLVVEDESSDKRLAFKCPICKKVFDSQKLFRKHATIHVSAKGLVCKYCEKWFQTQSSLSRHERIHSGEKPFRCLLCDRLFSQREILQRHILTHTDTKPFQCQHCDKSYTQKEGLNNHLKHNHSKVRVITQYPCPLCEKAFCHPSGLSRHMVMHTGKIYLCSFCSRSFTDSSSLRRHTKSQHAE